jgi:RNA polymerase sigma-70 factor (ECF subfamily)
LTPWRRYHQAVDSGWVARATAGATLLTAARDGDAHAFAALVRPHRRALHLHCYRMLGSLTAAGTVTVEALLRARRGLRGYPAEQALHPWLLRVTTAACLRTESRLRRAPADVTAVEGLQPYPDVLLDQLSADGSDPAGTPAGRDTLALPFIAALQVLPGPQRATAVLHDVLGRPLPEVARVLGVPESAATRSLAGARRILADARAGTPQDARTHCVLPGGFVEAWRSGDRAALSAMVAEQVTAVLPPERAPRRGRGPVTSLLAERPAGRGPDRFEVVEIRANGCPAVAVYTPPTGAGGYQAWALVVLTVVDGRVTDVQGFGDDGLFEEFGLPTTLERPGA